MRVVTSLAGKSVPVFGFAGVQNYNSSRPCTNFKSVAGPCHGMARETDRLDTLLAGAVGVTAGLVIGSRALRYYRKHYRRSGARIICTRCGESHSVESVLDPTVTCGCMTANEGG